MLPGSGDRRNPDAAPCRRVQIARLAARGRACQDGDAGLRYMKDRSYNNGHAMPASTPSTRRRTIAAAGARAGHESIASATPDDRAALCEVSCVDGAKVARARSALPSEPTLASLADTLRALGDPTRLKIVCALAARGVDELCVCDLTTLVDVSSSAVSHSLRTLRELGVVRYRKVGKIAYYALDDTHVAGLVSEGVRHAAERRSDRPRRG
jgi:ArsR family transcriptional regulator, lead/cadmium/zinc/bismuth-responsive transcriptional repressor